MQYIKGTPRDQLAFFPTNLDELIDQNNSVRFIDLFVNSLDFSLLGFDTKSPEGRRSYNPADLLKLYIYGYMNKIRSSRDLEKECYRNIEVMWLIGNLKPDHNTINRFRKDNPKAIKHVFRQTVSLAQNFNLIGGLLIAGDSTKLRAQNSKKNNYNQKKIEQHLERIDKKLDQFNKQLQLADGDKKKDLENDIQKKKHQKKKYLKLKDQLLKSDEKQISTTDPDSRHQIVRNNITEVCYTVQTTTDALYNIPFDYKVTNQNDKKAMGNMLQRAKSILKNNSFTALYDKGYHTGSEFKTAHDLGIKTLVAIPGIGRASQAPNPDFNVENFYYNIHTDTYHCPQGHNLKSNGKWYKTRNYHFKQYKTKACKLCPVMHLCTTAKHNGKIVQRSEYQVYIEQNAQRVKANQNLYKKRQAIVEHPFGTIKRQWGFDYILTKKSSSRASADVGLIFIAYNLKRILNIIGIESLFKFLKKSFIAIFNAFKSTLYFFKEIFRRFLLFLKINQKNHLVIFKHISSLLT